MSSITCPLCEHRCSLSEGGTGFCRMITAKDGRIAERFPHRYSSLQVAHIETVPFFHYQPGSRTLILGSAGCTFDCHYCSNAYIARSDPEPLLTYSVPPERVVKFAQDYGCHNIAFAVNEPTVMLPSLLEVAKAAHAAGLPMGALTNGYTQPETTEQLGRAFDFVNVSIKGLQPAFYKEHVGLTARPGRGELADIVLDNIARLDTLTHVEVSTPIVQGVNDTDIPAIAERLSGISRTIPWHVFRLLPEYKMADYQRPSIDAVVSAAGADTPAHGLCLFRQLCRLQLGQHSLPRMSVAGCRADQPQRLQLQSAELCTGRPAALRAMRRRPGDQRRARRVALERQGGIMDIGLIDVREWQTEVDLRTGLPLKVDHPLLALGRRLIAEYPYPGDLNQGGDRWVTDVAVALEQAYQPGLMCLDYAGLFFPSVFGRLALEDRQESIDATFAQVSRFADMTGFRPVIVGLGELTPLQGQIDTTGLDGMAIAGGMTVRYAGINQPSRRDLDWLAQHPGVERVISTAEMRQELGGRDEFYTRAPEYLAIANEGWVFRGVNTGARPLQAIPAYDDAIPVYGLPDTVGSLTDIADAVLDMAQTERVALILVEAVGCQTFPLPAQHVGNACDWYHYAVGDTQYRAIATGERFCDAPYPPGYRYELYDDEVKPYPFSGIAMEFPARSIGRRFAGRSAAVGARAVMTHSVFGADITIECFVRALYNHGVMAAIRADEA